MRKLLLLIILFFNSHGFSQNSKGILYIKNEGQWDSEIKFKAEIPGGQLFIKSNSLEYLFYDTKKLSELHARKNIDSKSKSFEKINTSSVKVEFINSNLETQINSSQPVETIYNYFQGDDESKWKSNVRAYKEITINNIYEGIDLRLYAVNQSLKYEYIVAGEANYSNIKMKYSGHEKIELNQNSLNFKTNINVFKEFQPYTFQKINNVNNSIESNFELKDDIVSFRISENYDHSKPLIIDPELVFSTYSGSVSDNWAHTAAYDAQGHLYAGGSVFGSNFPSTKGVFQEKAEGVSQGGGVALTDVVIMKFSPDGSKLIYATFLGGKSSEVPHSMITNNKGELVIFGTTSSSNFPVSSKAYQKKFGGGTGYTDGTGIAFPNGSDIFVSVLSEKGDKLIGSTFIGGSGNDGYNQTLDPANPINKLNIRNYGDEFRGEVVTDLSNNIFVGTITHSANFPLVNPSKKERNGFTDGVVLNLNPDCSELKWSTLVGGKAFDAVYSLKVGKSGSVYACGGTSSNDLPTNSTVLNPNFGGIEDGFIVKYQPNKSLENITYLGTESPDIAYLLDLDTNENVHIFGLSRGKYPVSENVYSNPNSGQFIHSLSSDLSKTNFSTVIGSGRNKLDIVPTAFLVNECGNIYLSGWGGRVNIQTDFNSESATNGLPVTNDAFQKTTTGSNFYLMILERNAKKILYGSFFGSFGFSNPLNERGDHVDGGTCRFDKSGIIYHVNCACQPTGDSKAYFPISKNAIAIQGGNENCNMAAFKFDTEKMVISGKSDKLEGCEPLTVNFENTSLGGKKVEWDFNDGLYSTNFGKVNHIFEKAGTYQVKMKIYNEQSCNSKSDSIIYTVKVFAQPTNVTVSKDTTICGDAIIKLNATGGNSYKWTPSELLSNYIIGNPITKSITKTTVFTVEIDNGGTCKAIKSIKIKVDDNKEDFKVSNDTTLCSNQTINLFAKSTASKIEWSGNGIQNKNALNQSIKTKESTSYSIKAFYADGCKPIKTINVNIDNSKDDFKVSTDKEICKGQSVTFNATSSADKVVWSGNLLDNVVSNSITVTPSKSETYSVQAFYKDGCTPIQEVNAIIDETYKPDFEVDIKEYCGRENTINFINKTSSKAVRFVWKFNNSDSINIKTPVDLKFSKAGKYEISLKALNKIGCELQTTKTVDLPASITFLPNVITPNNDGKNDVFNTNLKDISISIYDRYGKVIYTETDYKNDWGNGIETGTYYYLIKTKTETDCKGWVQVFK